MPAVIGAEVEQLPLVLRVRGGVRDLHLHPADGIDRIPLAPAETLLVPRQPPEGGENDPEGDVEECRVVPVERRRGDRLKADRSAEDKASILPRPPLRRPHGSVFKPSDSCHF